MTTVVRVTIDDEGVTVLTEPRVDGPAPNVTLNFGMCETDDQEVPDGGR